MTICTKYMRPLPGQPGVWEWGLLEQELSDPDSKEGRKARRHPAGTGSQAQAEAAFAALEVPRVEHEPRRIINCWTSGRYSSGD